MQILAFETSAKAASVALVQDGKLLGESYQNTGMTHSQTLMVMAEDLLHQCGVTVSQLDGVAVANGPGSFTGIRIGVAAAKGFAWGAELPCIGVSTLAAMAVGLGAWQGYVDCGKYTRIREDRAISLRDLREDVKNLAEPIFLVGDGSVLCYNTLLEEVPALVLPPEHRMHQRACGVALEAQRMMAQGNVTPAAELVPNYLRLSQAERERNERMQNQ